MVVSHYFDDKRDLVRSVYRAAADRNRARLTAATSKDGTDVADSPASLGDLFATVYKGLGLDPGTKIRDNLGRPLEIADGKPLKGLV